MTLLVLPLFSFAVKREEVEFMGIRRPSASRLRQTHGRVPNETSSFITMISNLRACKWRLNGSVAGFLVFRTYYRLLRTLITRNCISCCEAEVLPALNFFKNSLFHSPANLCKYRHWGDRRKCLYSLTGCPYQAGWIEGLSFLLGTKQTVRNNETCHEVVLKLSPGVCKAGFDCIRMLIIRLKFIKKLIHKFFRHNQIFSSQLLFYCRPAIFLKTCNIVYSR